MSEEKLSPERKAELEAEYRKELEKKITVSMEAPPLGSIGIPRESIQRGTQIEDVKNFVVTRKSHGRVTEEENSRYFGD